MSLDDIFIGFSKLFVSLQQEIKKQEK